MAQGTPPAEVFEAVCAEVGRLLPADASGLGRYEADGTVTVLGTWTSTGGYEIPLGTRIAPEEEALSGLVLKTRRPERIDSYAETTASGSAARDAGWRSGVGAPVIVEGRLWGLVAVASTSDRTLPLDTEVRLAGFTELVATAMANAESRDELTRLAEQQAALRRVATLVAQGRPGRGVRSGERRSWSACSRRRGCSRPLRADGTVNTVGSWSRSEGFVPVGTRQPLGRAILSQQILETRRPARINSYAEAGAEVAREMGWRSGVGAPVIVQGRIWGLVAVASTTDRPLPPDTEGRLIEFTELLATAIANAESRAELDASRARIVATADAARQRIERDIHDGAQQQLVSLAFELRGAQAAVPPEHRAELSRIAEGLTSVLEGLREIAHGIHPAILAEGGIGPALTTLAGRSTIPVELEVRAEGRLPERVEVAAYYVVSEALTNAAKYAQATVVHVDVEARERVLLVAVRDDGLGGADPARGSGLLGLKDRAEAIGGTLSLQSQRDAGTSLHVELPLDDHHQ